MICVNCKTAGSRNTGAVELRESGLDITADAWEKEAAELHGLCLTKDCSCQHKTGPGYLIGKPVADKGETKNA